jgi:sialic acid synthase SpsE
MTAVKEIEFKSIFSSLQDFNQVYFIGTGGEYHYADLQILYTKGRDLALRIVDEKNSRLSARDTVSEIQGKASFFPSNPFVIAEIGLNHGGSLALAKDLMRAAKDSGVKFVKFQTYKSELRVSQVYRSNNYFEEVVDTEENLYSMFKKYELKQSDWIEIFRFGDELGLKVFSAVFDDVSLELLEQLNCPAYKIASMDLNNYPLIEKIAQTRKPIILSTGMSTLGEIEKAVSIIERHSPEEFIILHCISSYPANKDSLNLSAMSTLRNAFGRPVGFSDHTIGPEVPIVAVSIGAACVEKHFTLDHSLEGPDHIFSLNPKEMGYLVGVISEIPGMLGRPHRITTAQEIETSYKFKKSIHARRDISKGHVLTEADVIIKGPYGGIPPEYYENVIGRTVKEDIHEDYPVTWEIL